MRTARTEPGPVADEARSSSVSAESGRTDGPGEIIDADDHLVGRVARGDAGA